MFYERSKIHFLKLIAKFLTLWNI